MRERDLHRARQSYSGRTDGQMDRRTLPISLYMTVGWRCRYTAGSPLGTINYAEGINIGDSGELFR